MSATLIKICGLSTPETIAAAAQAGATHVGLVHFPKSPRHVSLERAGELRRTVPDGVQTVLLVVDPDGLTLSNAVELVRPDVIQFHGDEPPEALVVAKRHAEAEVWKAIAVRDAASLASVADYAGAADRVLLDAPAPLGSDLPGGNGAQFSWDLLDGHEHTLPWGLAGGLTPANVATAIRATGAPLVDASSGVECAPGVKDVDLIRAFCKAAREA